jgi:ribonuclease HI
MKPRFQLFAAGACLNDGEPGGWIFRIVHPKSGTTINRSGAITCGTTLLRTQMFAVVRGLERIKQKSKVELFSLIGGELAEGLPNWKKDRHHIENEDLWARLEKLCGKTGHVVEIGEADLKSITAVAEKIAITLSWQRGLPILPRTEWPNEKPPQEEFFKKFEEMKRRRELRDKQLFVLQSADGDFVSRVDDDGHSTVCGPHFVFTKDRDKARVFRYDELWRTSDLASQFAEGFSGSRSRRITVTL